MRVFYEKKTGEIKGLGAHPDRFNSKFELAKEHSNGSQDETTYTPRWWL
jgi:hypothetical protein